MVDGLLHLVFLGEVPLPCKELSHKENKSGLVIQSRIKANQSGCKLRQEIKRIQDSKFYSRETWQFHYTELQILQCAYLPLNCSSKDNIVENEIKYV